MLDHKEHMLKKYTL